MNTDKSIIAQHYQNTFEFTARVWEKRNRTSLLLLFSIGVSTLLTFNVSQAQPLLVDLIAKLLSIDDPKRYEDLVSSFPYGFFQTILLAIVLYLTFLLYQRTQQLENCSEYLRKLEKELHSILSIPDDSVAFTQGQEMNLHLSSVSIYFYVALKGVFLLTFIGGRVFYDFTNGQYLLGVVDILISIPTVIFFMGYALLTTMLKLGYFDFRMK